MIDLYGVLQEQETINGELGLGVDYYKGEKGDTPIKGVDYLTPDDVKEISDKVLEQVEAGTKGEDGKSAYQIALDEGFEGSEAEWLASLKGKTPVKGVDYFTQEEIQQIENNAAAKVDLSDYAKTADLSTVATSGSYEDLKNKPTIPAPYTLPTASTSTLGGVKVDGSTITITNGVISSVSGGSGSSVEEVYVGASAPSDADIKLWVDTTTSSTTEAYTKAEIDAKGFQTEAQVQALINTALGVIENGTY